MTEPAKKSDTPADSHDNDSEQENLAVGYCRPPKHSQFKPGTSGNPRGRPPSRANLNTLLRKVYSDPINIWEGETKRMVPRVVAIHRALVQKALKGDIRAAQVALAYAKEFGAMENSPRADGLTFEQLEAMSPQDLRAYIEIHERAERPPPEVEGA